jgi:hypothetical protein
MTQEIDSLVVTGRRLITPVGVIEGSRGLSEATPPDIAGYIVDPEGITADSRQQTQSAISSGIENIACERDRGCALAVKPPATICDPFRIKARFRPTVAKRRLSAETI